MSRCKACGKDITWIKTPAGKHMPVESYGFYSSVSGGTVVLPNGEVMPAAKLSKLIKAYRPHWGNCLAAAQFKKKEPEVGT